MWMEKENPQCPFERYADDIVVHCSSREEGEEMLKKLKARMEGYELTLHTGENQDCVLQELSIVSVQLLARLYSCKLFTC